MNISLLGLYPLLPVVWIASVVALAIWSRPVPALRSVKRLAALLAVVVGCVVVRSMFVEGAAVLDLRTFGSAVLAAIILVMPAAWAGTRALLWLERRGASRWRALAAATVIVLLVGAVALPVTGLLLLLAFAWTGA